MVSKQNRNHRLRILQCFLDNSPFVRRKEDCTVCYDSSVVSLVVSWKDSNDIICGLRDQDVVSHLYNINNLRMDIWYLTRDVAFNPAIQKSTPSLHDTESKLLFQIIFKSLVDLHIGRPCDFKIWKRDLSPDFRFCVQSDHLCYYSAEEYLLGLNGEVEEFIGVSPGTISQLVHVIKRKENNWFSFLDSNFLDILPE